MTLRHHTISAVFLSMSREITPSEFHEKLGETGKQPTENLTEKEKNTARLKKIEEEIMGT